VIGSTIKGLITGLLIGLFERKVQARLIVAPSSARR
jgi:hypothetical protein